MKKGLLSLVLAPVILLSLVACGDKKDDPAPTSTPVATTSSTNAGGEGGEGGGGGTTTAVSTVAAVKAMSAGATAKTRAKVMAVTTRSLLIADTTGKIVVWLNAAPNASVDDHVEVSGTLAARSGNIQFGVGSTVTVLGDAAPAVTDTPTAWATNDFVNYVSTAEGSRPLGTLISFSGTIAVNDQHTNINLEGEDNVQGSISYMPSSFSSVVVDGAYLNMTGYVVDVSSNKYVNVYLVSAEAPAEKAKVESVTVSCAKTTMITGTKLPLTVSVLPAAADQGVTWTSSDTSVATVDSDGVVTGVVAGTATITATSVGDTETVGTKATGTISITVAASTLGTIVDEDHAWVNTENTLSPDKKTLSFSTNNFVYTISESNNEMNPEGTATAGAWQSLRWYRNSKLNIVGKSNQKIVKIVINMDDYSSNQYVAEPTYYSAKDAAGVALTADMAKIASVEKDGSTYTIDFSNIGGLTEITYTASTQIRIKSFTISYIA